MNTSNNTIILSLFKLLIQATCHQADIPQCNQIMLFKPQRLRSYCTCCMMMTVRHKIIQSQRKKHLKNHTIATILNTMQIKYCYCFLANDKIHIMQTYLLFVDFLLVKQQYMRMIQSTITMNRRKATKEPDITL